MSNRIPGDPKVPTESISILGSGWLGLPLARELVARGYAVKTSTTRSQRLPELAQIPSEPHLVDIRETLDSIDGFLQSATLIVNITSKDLDGFQRLLERIEAAPSEKVESEHSVPHHPLHLSHPQ